MTKPLTITLVDGTVIHEGDVVRAQGEASGWVLCTVLTILRGGGVDKAILTRMAPLPPLRKGVFGTVIRSRYQIKNVGRGE